MRIFLVPNRKNLLFWSILPPVKAIFNSIVYDLIFAFLPKDFRFQKKDDTIQRPKETCQLKKSLVVSLEKRCHISREVDILNIPFHTKGQIWTGKKYVSTFFLSNWTKLAYTFKNMEKEIETL